MATTRAVLAARRLKERLGMAQNLLDQLSVDTDLSTIQSKLLEVETIVENVHDSARQIKREPAAVLLTEIHSSITNLKQSLRPWRQKHPDTSPYRIDNSEFMCSNVGCI